MRTWLKAFWSRNGLQRHLYGLDYFQRYLINLFSCRNVGGESMKLIYKYCRIVKKTGKRIRKTVKTISETKKGKIRKNSKKIWGKAELSSMIMKLFLVEFKSYFHYVLYFVHSICLISLSYYICREHRRFSQIISKRSLQLFVLLFLDIFLSAILKILRKKTHWWRHHKNHIVS